MPRININDLPERYQQQIASQLANRAPNPVTDVEPHLSNAPVGAKETPRFDTLVRIHVHSVRKRLADPGGISEKAAVDGLTKAGVLRDDSAKYVKEITDSQAKAAKGEEEQTIITIVEARV